MRPGGAAALAAGAVAGVLGGCAAGTAASGPPLSSPAEVAAQLRDRAGPERPYRVRLTWDYSDPRGPVSGDGVLRFNPPDSLRLDLFGPGDGSMSVALAGSGLRSVGQIEDLRLPPPAFLYASAGLFRPRSGAPDRGYRSGEDRVLVYGTADGDSLRFRVRGRRLRGVRELRNGRTLREVELTWPDSGAWPASALYRDRERESRARWSLERARPADAPFPRSIFDLPRARQP